MLLSIDTIGAKLQIIIMKQQNLTYQNGAYGSNETVSLHIGIKPMRLCSNTYNTEIVSYTDDCHLIVNHGQDLLIYNSKKKQVTHKTHSNHLSGFNNVTFSNRWRCIFLLDAHQYLSAYAYLNSAPNTINPTPHNQNDQLLLLANQIDLKSLRHCIDFLYIDEYNAFIVLDADTLKIVYVTIHTNHLRSLFSNAYRFRIEETRVRVLQETYFLQFANEIIRVGEYFVMYNSQDVKIIWHANDPNFNDRLKDDEITTNELIRSITNSSIGSSPSSSNARKRVLLIKKICDSPEQVSTILFNPELCILICGTSQGDLKVFKINMKSLIATVSPSKKSGKQLGQIEIEAKTQLLFKLSLHNYKSILNIQLYSPKVVLSIGSDQYMQVVSLDQMASIERFKCDTNLNKIKFINNSLFMAVKTIEFDQYLYAYQVALNYQLLMQHNSQILHYFYIDSLCVLVLSDNSVNALQIDKERLRQNKSIRKVRRQQAKNQIEEEQKSNNLPMLPRQSFVPPRCKSILGMQCFPYRDKDEQQVVQFWILTDQSQIYEYKYQKVNEKNEESAKQEKSKNIQFEIIGLHEVKCFKDSYSHQTKYKVNKMKFIDLAPVHYDSDIKQKHYEPNLKEAFHVKPIIFGTQTGQIIIASTLTINKIISRIRLFGQPVLSITTAYFPPQQVDLSKYNNDSLYSINDQQGGQIGQRAGQKNQQNKSIVHQRRLVVFSSYKQIICVIFSNCQIPQTVYKVMLAAIAVIPKYSIKNITQYFISIVTGNTPKVIFPSHARRKGKSNQSSYGIKLWSPKIIIHEGPITCIEYCKNLQIISGDRLGKIAIWNLHSEILLTIVVTEAVSIQLAYFFNHSIIFGHHGKVFIMSDPIIAKNAVQIDHQMKIQEQLIKNQTWVIQNTKQLSSGTSPAESKAILQLFKESSLNKFTRNSNEEQQSKIQNLYKNDKKPRIISNKKQLSLELNRDTNQESQPFDKYVSDMKKSFVKLAHQVDGYSPDTQIPKSKAKDQKQKKKGNTSRNKKIQRIETLKVRSTAKFIEVNTQQSLKQGMIVQRENFRLKRAKSILNKFKQQQNREDAEEIIKTAREMNQAKEIQMQKEISKVIVNNKEASLSLPQIKNYSSIHKKEQLSLTEIEDKEETSGRKKNRNKKYQFLFHFPKQGLYSQLISKNLLQ